MKLELQGIIAPKEEIRLHLLEMYSGDVEKAENANDFIFSEPTPGIIFNKKDVDFLNPISGTFDVKAETDFDDGIYYIMKNDCEYEPYKCYDDELSEEIIKKIVAIGIQKDGHRLMIALHDLTEKEATLTTGETETNNYHSDLYDAITDWDGKGNTERMYNKLNPNFNIPDGWWIPSLGEMYFIYLNMKYIQEALKKVNAEPLAENWYWTSTENSSTCAWFLSLSDGYAYWTTKASSKLRVRAVSAFNF